MDDMHSPNRPSEVIYQIYPASFKDSNGDGHGDLKGITEKLDYIKNLGTDAIWISPFFLSPEGKDGDGGYAISDYRKIDPRFGTMEDFEALIKKAHETSPEHPRPLKVYTDFVLCHTSNQHDWFQKSRDRAPGFEDRYVWHEGHINGDGHRHPPNNWLSVFPDKNDTREHGRNASAWTFDEKRQQYYLHHFNDSQPALNLNSKAVQDTSLAEMKFWLDKGVDGLRLDALPYATYDPQFRDNPWADGWKPGNEKWSEQVFEHSICQPETIKLVGKIRAMMDGYHPPKTALGEVVAGARGGSGSIAEAAKYLGPGGLDSAYHNDGFMRIWDHYPDAQTVRGMVQDSITHSPNGGFCNNLGNHDFPRFSSRIMGGADLHYEGTINKQIMALAVAIPGSLCMYQGEELGLPQATETELQGIQRDLIPYNQGGRDGCRTPMPWISTEKHAGFSSSDDAYLPIPRSHLALAVDQQENWYGSTLNFTRRILQQRAENPALQIGTTKVLGTHNDIVAFTRKTKDQTVLCAFNISGKEVAFTPSDYLDDHTLQQLNLTSGQVIRIGPYDTSFHGLHPPAQGVETGLRPAEHYTNGNGHTHGKTVFAVDLLIADHHVDEADVAKPLTTIMEKYGLKKGDKATIDKEDYQTLLQESHAHGKETLTAGGSTATALATTKKLLGDDIKVNVMGAVADDEGGKTIREFLQKSDVNIIDGSVKGADQQVVPTWPTALPAETAASFIINHPDGKHTVLTYPGQEKEALNEALANAHNRFLLEKNILHSDIIYFPESITSKFDPSLRDAILESRWRNKKELVLTLPSRADFGPDDSKFYKYLTGSCNVVMGNDVEFCRIFDNDENAKRPVEQAQIDRVVAAIQAEFKKDELQHAGMPYSKAFGQVAFITRGNDHPALVVTRDGPAIPIPPYKVDKIRNMLGAGHATFAGFLTGYIKGRELEDQGQQGISHKQSARLAMALAAEKVQQKENAPYLMDPKTSLALALTRHGMDGIASKFESEQEQASWAQVKR